MTGSIKTRATVPTGVIPEVDFTLLRPAIAECEVAQCDLLAAELYSALELLAARYRALGFVNSAVLAYRSAGSLTTLVWK